MRAALLFVACLALTVAAESEKKIICYSIPRLFDTSPIDPSLCTHLVYTFVELENDGIKVPRLNDLPDRWGDVGGFGLINALRWKNPHLKTMIAIGSWTAESTNKYLEMASNSTSREKFANNAATFVKRWNFNGLALHWWLPRFAKPGPNDMQNYVELIKALRKSFDREELILSATLNSYKIYASNWYNISEISKHLDFINLLYFDAYDEVEIQNTAINAPLYHVTSDVPGLSINETVTYWLSHGAPREKLTIGVPMFGHTYTLDNPNEHGVDAHIRGVGAPGRHSRRAGFLEYREICELYTTNEWNFVFDEVRRAPYAFRDYQWISYDNVKSVREKAEFVANQNLGGATVWHMQNDDWNGTCSVRYPLLKTLNAVLRGGSPVPEETLPSTAGMPECVTICGSYNSVY